MNEKIKRFQTWIFDCDGVLLDSNKIKSEVFYQVALPYGIKKAKEFVLFHKNHGGISRYIKMNYFFSVILQKDNYEEELQNMVKQYGEILFDQLMNAPLTDGMEDLLKSLEKKKKYVVSGGCQTEIRDIFLNRGINTFFDEIYGNPDSKTEIIERLIHNEEIKNPAVIIGDSLYDYEVAVQNKLDFIFMSKYSEFNNWEEFFNKRPSVLIIDCLSALLK